MIKNLFTSAAIWTTLGLASGLFYREFTRQRDFAGFTQLFVAFVVYGVDLGAEGDYAATTQP